MSNGDAALARNPLPGTGSSRTLTFIAPSITSPSDIILPANSRLDRLLRDLKHLALPGVRQRRDPICQETQRGRGCTLVENTVASSYAMGNLAAGSCLSVGAAKGAAKF